MTPRTKIQISRFPEQLWNDIAAYTKDQLLSKYDPTKIVSGNESLKSRLVVAHKGFYLSIEDSNGKDVVQSGFLEDDHNNVLESLNRVINAVYLELQAKSIPVKVLNTAKLHFTVVLNLIFIENGLQWDINEDGVYFSWGDQYKALYLPHEIKRMTVPKGEIMNRLCAWKGQVPSNFWRLPCGLVHKLICDSYSS